MWILQVVISIVVLVDLVSIIEITVNVSIIIIFLIKIIEDIALSLRTLKDKWAAKKQNYYLF